VRCNTIDEKLIKFLTCKFKVFYSDVRHSRNSELISDSDDRFSKNEKVTGFEKIVKVRTIFNNKGLRE
jgi:hypothetical protein